MLFWRDRPVGSSLWQRFRTAPEGFTAVEEEGGYWAFHVVAGRERIVELFFSLLGELPAAASLELADKRSARAWKGRCEIAAARAALDGLRALLVAHGGVEITVFTEDDQLTLNPKLELFIYSHSQRWGARLEGKGIEEQRMVRTKSWRMAATELADAPALSDALASAAASLALVSA